MSRIQSNETTKVTRTANESKEPIRKASKEPIIRKGSRETIRTPVDNGDKEKEEKEPHNSKLSPIIQNIKGTSTFVAELMAFVNKTKSLLVSETGLVEFDGMQADPTSSCAHVKLKNTTDTTVTFAIRTPEAPYFTVGPKVGFIESGKETTIYCSFNGKAPAIPPDGTFMYSIHQIALSEKRTRWIKEDTTTTNVRKYWKDRYGESKYILRLPVVFSDKKTSTCHRHHRNLVNKRAPVGANGQAVVAQEEEYDPDKHKDDSENLPSATIEGKTLKTKTEREY